MAAATNEQVQQFVNNRIRPRAQQIRALLLSMEDDIAALDDVYANLTDSPDWTDNRPDGPPHLLEPNDVLAINTFLHDMTTAMRGNAQLPVVLKACVHPV
jgi:hypothetical protein